MKLINSKYILNGLKLSFINLNPWNMRRNPVMFIVEIGAVITTIYTVSDFIGGRNYSMPLNVSIWLWLTVVFANFAEALAEIQGKARAGSLRSTRNNLSAKKIINENITENVYASDLRKGNLVIVSENEIIPGDGDIISGTGLVDESAITGESAPVIREAGGDRCGVTGGTKLLSGVIKIKITANPGETFLDNMIKMGIQQQNMYANKVVYPLPESQTKKRNIY